MEFANTNHDDLRTAHKGPPRKPDWENRNIYVHANKNDDGPEMEDRRMVYRNEPTLQETASVDDWVMAQQNTNHENSDADAKQSNDTSKNTKKC